MYKLVLKYNNFIVTLLKIGFSITALFFLWHQQQLRLLIEGDYHHLNYSFVLLILLMSLTNWFFEIKKWQKLVKNVQTIDFQEAFKQSLTAFSLSLLTPNRIGEFGAKAVFFKKTIRKKILWLSIAGAWAQLSMSLFFGVLALVYVLMKNIPFHALDFVSSTKIWSAGIVIIIIVFILSFYRKKINVSRQIRKDAITYSFIRFLIFSLQFVLLLRFFQVSNSYAILFSGVFLIYFFTALIPVLSLFDWAVKGSVAIWVFNGLQIQNQAIIQVVGIMWLLNFFIPFVLGWWLIIKYKFTVK
jgi:hypothetical protein